MNWENELVALQAAVRDAEPARRTRAYGELVDFALELLNAEPTGPLPMDVVLEMRIVLDRERERELLVEGHPAAIMVRLTHLASTQAPVASVGLSWLEVEELAEKVFKSVRKREYHNVCEECADIAEVRFRDKVIRKLADLREPEKIVGWMCVIARNALKDRYRKGRRRKKDARELAASESALGVDGIESKYIHLAGCPKCHPHLVATHGGIRIGEPSAVPAHTLDVDAAYEDAVGHERELRPACPRHLRQVVCPEESITAAKIDNRESREDALEDLRQFHKGFAHVSDETAGRRALRGIVCFDWWHYVGSAAADPRPGPDYETATFHDPVVASEVLLANEWCKATEESKQTPREQAVVGATQRQIGDSRYQLLDHLRLKPGKDPHEFDNQRYLLDGAVQIYQTRGDLQRVIQHQLGDLDTFLRARINPGGET